MTGFLKRKLEASRRLKGKLARKEVATLVHCSHHAPSMMERLGEHGFDAVLIDAEHGSVGREAVEEMSRAAALADTVALIRPEGSMPHYITGYLGCAVDGFMMPLIRSVAHAQDLVQSFRFSAPVDYPDRVLVLMIEHIDAVNCLPELLKVEGVDCFLVAPWDLALSMGEDLVGKPSIPPRVYELIDETLDTIVKSDKAAGMCVNFDNADKYVAKGVSLLYNHADHLLASGAQKYFSTLDSAKGRTGRK